jgi:hypothetical protein
MVAARFHLRHTTAALLKMSGVASDASFPVWREGGAVGDPDRAHRRPHAAHGEKSQVSVIVCGPGCGRCHDVTSASVTSHDCLMQLGQRQRRTNEDKSPQLAVPQLEVFDTVGKPLPTS